MKSLHQKSARHHQHPRFFSIFCFIGLLYISSVASQSVAKTDGGADTSGYPFEALHLIDDKVNDGAKVMSQVAASQDPASDEGTRLQIREDPEEQLQLQGSDRPSQVDYPEQQPKRKLIVSLLANLLPMNQIINAGKNMVGGLIKGGIGGADQNVAYYEGLDANLTDVLTKIREGLTREDITPPQRSELLELQGQSVDLLRDVRKNLREARNAVASGGTGTGGLNNGLNNGMNNGLNNGMNNGLGAGNMNAVGSTLSGAVKGLGNLFKGGGKDSKDAHNDDDSNEAFLEKFDKENKDKKISDGTGAASDGAAETSTAPKPGGLADTLKGIDAGDKDDKALDSKSSDLSAQSSQPKVVDDIGEVKIPSTPEPPPSTTAAPEQPGNSEREEAAGGQGGTGRGADEQPIESPDDPTSDWTDERSGANDARSSTGSQDDPLSSLLNQSENSEGERGQQRRRPPTRNPDETKGDGAGKLVGSIGGAVAGVAVILGIAGFVVVKNRKRRETEEEDEDEDEV